MNFKDIFTKNYVKGYFSRNKKIYLISIVLFLFLGLFGMAVRGVPDAVNITANSLDDDIYDDTYLNNTTEGNFNGFLSLFVNNSINDVSCIIGGLLLGIPTLFISFTNATNFISIFLTWPADTIIYGIIPHGIFEIPSSLFALAGGIMLFKTELNIIKGLLSSKTTVNEQLNESECLIKDAIITIIIVFVLLFFAALVEEYITPGLVLSHVTSI